MLLRKHVCARPFGSTPCWAPAPGARRTHVARADGNRGDSSAGSSDPDAAPSTSSSSQEQRPGEQQPDAAVAAATAAAASSSSSSNPLIAGVDAKLQVSRDVIETLRSRVFGIDTMWVTSVENYEQGGVVFKGNVRANNTAAAYAKLKQRLHDVMGDDWQIFLIQDKEEKPTAVLLPSSARESTLSPVTEVWLCVVFGLLSIVSSLQSAGIPLFQFLTNPFYTELTQQDVLDALPLAGAFWLTLLLHEAGHRVAAAKRNQQLYLPLIVPAGFGFVGSFGGITRFKGFVPDRATLLDVAVAGPLWGTAASGGLLLAGLGLTASGLGDLTVESPSFADSFLIGLLGQFTLGDALANPEVRVSSLFVAGWAGLVVNALNVLPTGELDGGRMALALFGRRAATAVGVLTIIGLALFSFNNPLAFYWVLLILALQRGPILPCQEELTAPEDAGAKNTALALFALPLLMLLPYPVELLVAMQAMPDPTPF